MKPEKPSTESTTSGELGPPRGHSDWPGVRVWDALPRDLPMVGYELARLLANELNLLHVRVSELEEQVKKQAEVVE